LQPPAIIEQPVKLEESKKNSYAIPMSSEGSEQQNYLLPEDDNDDDQDQEFEEEEEDENQAQ